MVSMNRLSTEKRTQVLRCLVEGMSIRATVRVTGAAKNTVVKLLADVGQACTEYQDGALQELGSTRIECDEIWAYCYAKQKNVPKEHQGTFGYGDVWTFTAIDADTKLVPSFLVGERTNIDAEFFLRDLASRLTRRIQLTTDAAPIYRDAVHVVWRGEIDYAQLRKVYSTFDKDRPETRYSQPVCTGTERHIRSGRPDPDKISTSYVERQNLTMRMGMRRFTRLTNAFSKKLENLAHAVALHFMHYNFCRPHQSLGKKTTPAMAAGITDHVWTVAEIVDLLDQTPVRSSN
jgi:IS1 family transposase